MCRYRVIEFGVPLPSALVHLGADFGWPSQGQTGGGEAPMERYGVLVVLFGAALLLLARAEAKRDEMAAYVAHAMTRVGPLIAMGIGWGYGPSVLSVAGAAVFGVNFGFLVRRIRHS
jgi:lysylphosphatidylglycerol synthetase-like protein (DUF2156 family)